ncbi:hypothetical protein [Streptomyces sp. Isolate_45]|uniref:hypothetical protein n=1 Tax=Streptomyces sp. Isolate_45 TaxID=2950111 RepID=UPI002481D68A|nr:hypothetical protein [Streptomyces sp. Isolate_45]MDA5286573.1 hypothetical protein [Streptomyces sp. Isolate_45]
MATITAPLRANMDRLGGDFSDENIRTLGNHVPMLLQNGGTELLELWLEPVGQDYWLSPGETVIVTSYGSWSDHPFETYHEPECVQVWVSSCFATVTFPDGTEVPPAHRRPAGKYGS